MRRSSLSVAVVSAAALILSGLGPVPAFAGHNGHFGGHEMDGNTTVDNGGLDWESPPPGVVTFQDEFNGNDDIFTGGSKQNAPHQWSCGIGKAPGKNDLVSSQIYFRTFEGKQYVFFNWRRLTSNGDANIDYEFNQSEESNPACPDLPKRTQGDLLVAFDTDTGKNQKRLFVRAFEWTGNSTSGTFEPLFIGDDEASRGILWDAATGDDDLFGEGGINLTDALPEVFECGRFASAFVKTRSSTSISAALKDYVKKQPFDLGECPDSELHKQVRNETTGGAFTDSATASPGDVIEYQLTYHNHGNATAHNVVVTDTVPDHSTFLSCTGGCNTTGSGAGETITWNLGNQLAGAEVILTFRAELDASFPPGTTEISNVATVDSDDEPPKDSNETTVVVDAAPGFTVEKSASETSVNFGDSVTYSIAVTNTGNASGTTDVVDDYDQDRVSVSNISDDGNDDGDKITWTVTLDAGDSTTLTYTGTFDKPFSEGDPQGPCNEGQFVVVNTVTVTGDSDTEEVCVTAEPEFEVTKTASDNEVGFGDTVTYSITVTNIGDATGTTDVVDDYDEDRVNVSNISDGGNDDGDKITWTVTLDPGESKTLTYDATFDEPFTADDPQGDCPDGHFVVVNTVTVTGDSDSEQVCVEAAPEFEVAKSASETEVNFGDTITYTITVTNTGDGPGSTTVVDDYDAAHVTVSNINPAPTSHDTVNGVITWESGTLNPGDTGVFTYDATFDEPFMDGDPQGDCPDGHFVVVNTVTVTGDSDSEQVCVEAAPEFEVAKSASETEVNFGDTITYTITVTNTGNAPGSTDVVDDYDQDHVTVSNIQPAPTSHDTENGIITWTSGTLNPGDTAAFTYDATFDKEFDPDDPRGECPDGRFSVVNAVTVTGDSDSLEVCVAADPDLSLVKDADQTQVTAGDLITYTLSYSNDGSGPALDVVITEEVPEGTVFESCSDDCTVANGTVTWEIGTVAPDGSGSVTLTVSVLPTVGCLVCNQASIAAANHEATPSNELCIDATPAPRPDLANASGSAFGAQVRDSLLGIDTTLVPVSSAQSGIGSDGESDEVLGVNVPPGDGSLLSAAVLRTSSTSAVSEEPAQARNLSMAETVNVNILDGLVTADLIRGVAEATATGDSTAVSSSGSTFVNLVVNGVAYEDVTPNTRIDLPGVLFGPGSHVVLYERVASTSAPPAGQLEGGTYEADIEVTMIRVVLTDLLGLTTTEVVVSNAVAHADFPQTTVCEPRAGQGVSGHAFIASAVTDPSILPILVGYVDIPATGGHDHQNVEEARIPEDGSLVGVGVAFSDSAGTLGATSSDATSVAQAADVCLLPMNGECTVGAELVRSSSTSTADGLTASSSAESILVGVSIGGTPIEIGADPNQTIEIPGLGFVIFNEQFCDNAASLADGCDDGSGHAGLTVRAIRLVLTVPLGVEVIVAEAHSDATFTLPAPENGSGGNDNDSGGNGNNGGGGGASTNPGRGNKK